MKKILPGLVAGALLLVLWPAAALGAPATVTVRVEGATQTLQRQDHADHLHGPGSQAARSLADLRRRTSAGGALELATGGDWGGNYDLELRAGTSTESGLRTTQSTPAPEGNYWAFWLNGRPANLGACAQELEQGDEVLFFADCYGATCINPLPLRLTVPATATRGRALAAKVERLTGNGTATAVAGATIAGPGVSVQTAGDGTAQVTPPSAGRLVLTATATAGVRVAETVTVVEPGQALPPASGGGGGPVANDTSAPVTRLTGLRRGYARGRGPRRLAGTVTDPSGVQVIKLRLTRKRDGRCSWYSGRQERFRAGRCGRRAPWFAIGDDPTWSYLLPERLGPGRYTLEAKAVDKAFNRDDRRPARARFQVR